MSLDQFEELERRALEVALSTGRLEDLDKAVSISKQVADLRKAAKDSVEQPKLVKYEELKTWATVVVPLLSIATIAVTVYIQMNQLAATREANSDTSWRDTVKNVLTQLDKRATTVADPALAMSLLEPYVTDGPHSQDATLLSIDLLSRVASPGPFQDFFISHHLGEKWSDMRMLVDTNRHLYSDFLEVDGRLSGSTVPSVLQSARTTLVGNLEFLTQRICSLYLASPDKAADADLRGTFLLNCDLSGLDLASADITGAKLQSVNLENVILGEKLKYKDAIFVDSNWWDARKITRPLLESLVRGQYPYFDNQNVTYDKPPPDRVHYVKKLMELCGRVGIKCDPLSLKYGTAPSDSTPGVQSPKLGNK